MAATGGCLCGQVRYETKSAPLMTGICHCKNCQKQAGSAFSTLAAFQKTDIEFTGDLSLYADGDTDTGNTVSRYFCGTCGSPIYSAIPSQPDMAYLKTGTLDDTDGFIVMFHCWSSTKQDWVELSPDVPAFPQNAS
jgi:hypothetical protein